jgi:hypothetical protein
MKWTKRSNENLCLKILSNLLSRACKGVFMVVLSGALLLSGTSALAIGINGATVDLGGKTLTVSGSEFDKALTTPRVWVDQYQLAVTTYDAVTIVAVFGPDIFIELPKEFTLAVVIDTEETIPDENGDDVVVEDIESDEYCLGVLPGGLVYQCTETTGNLVPTTRLVQWLIPNDPRGDTYFDYSYKFGPTKDGSNKNKRGDPVYYQLMTDYSISLKDYLDNYDQNNFGDDLIDRCDDALPNLRDRLTALKWKGWPDTNPSGDTAYMAISDTGLLWIKKGYRWDGPTLDFGKTRILGKPSSLMRASLVHDAIYDLMRMKKIEHYWVRVAGSKAFYNRKLADCMIYMLSRQDHNSHRRAREDFDTIRVFGAAKTKDDVPDWKFHATADAGEYEPTFCAAATGSDFELNGENSNDATTFEWRVTDQDGGLVSMAAGEKPTVQLGPGTYFATLTVDDGNDGDISELYKDTDEAKIEVGQDSKAPVFLLAEDVAAANEPGQCIALVDLKIIATDECGPPEINCRRVPGNEPQPVLTESEFPVGTTQVECFATDNNHSTLTDLQITVSDNEAPVISGISAALMVWPPNHRYATFNLTDFVQSVTDNCQALSVNDARIVKVTSNEADDAAGLGDGNTINDIVIAADGQSVQLRKERQGGGSGRVYTIQVEAGDNSGNSATASFQVRVVKGSKT